MFTVLFIMTTLSLSAQARKPAVEDVFGVIPKDYQVIPAGQEVSINFQGKVPVIGSTDKQDSPSSAWPAFLGLFAMLSLPALMWFQLTHGHPSLKDEENSNKSVTPITHVHSNVAKMDDYRKEDNHTDHDKDDHKKAS